MGGTDSICCFRGSDNSKKKRVCWEITTDCNLKCAFCHRCDMGEQYYDILKIGETIDVLKKNGISNIIISGGEPLLHPDLLKIMKTLINAGFTLDLCTNGILMDHALAEGLKGFLSEVSVSLDSPFEKKHDTMRGVDGSFYATVNGIRNLVDTGFDVHVTMLVTEKNIADITPMTNFLSKLGVKTITFLGMIPIGVGHNALLDESRQGELRALIDTVRKKFHDININTKQLLIKESVCSCGAGKYVYGLGVDGVDLCSCLLLRDRKNKQFRSLPNVTYCPGNAFLTRRKDEC